MTVQDWESDVRAAQKAHIDGFALNIGPQDDYTDTALQMAYNAAETVGNFSVFISFDYLTDGPWPVDRVITTIDRYKNLLPQFKFDGKPLVSTFEGTGNTGDWPRIKDATGCAVIPSWTSLGPTGIKTILDEIDGMFSWDAWPVGAKNKTLTSDLAWINALVGKAYIMPVSPWFYTNLPQWNKNWLWRGDDLWHERWRQVSELQPPLVEIISWNDYGESHYIGPIHERGIPAGAHHYVSNHPHDAWRTFLPCYIDAYKFPNGDFKTANCTASPFNSTSSADKITYWYRLNPSGSGSHNGTTGNNPSMGQTPLNPGIVSEDRVFTTVLVTQSSSVTVQIGDGQPAVFHAPNAGVHHFSVPFNGQTGEVKIAIVRSNRPTVTVKGPAITDQCKNGIVDWNAVVGSSDALPGSGSSNSRPNA